MKKYIQIGSVLLVFALVIGLLSVTNLTKEECKGNCGENLTWKLDDTGLLTISGSGEMYDYDLNSEETQSPFMNNEDIQKVVIEEGITSIGDYAFYNCSKLNEITLPEGLESIGEHAFGIDEGIYGITLPSTITSIGKYAFERCINLQYIAIPDGVKTIEEGTFYRCKRLYSISLPDELESIDDHAFMQCLNLRSVVLPTTVKSIGTEAFSTCTYMEEICIPESVTSISTDAFDLTYNVEVLGPSGSYVEQYTTEKEMVFYSTVSDTFVDVADGLWFSNIVVEAYEKGLMTGTSESTFGPYDSVTRGMAATVLYRIAGSPEIEYQQYFSDVDETKYYAKAITYLAANGIVNTQNDTFDPTGKMTREAFCSIAKNLIEFLGYDTSSDYDLSQYVDYQNISSYAKDSMSWAIENDLLYMEEGDTSIHPKRAVTRAECAMMILGLYELVNSTPVENTSVE